MEAVLIILLLFAVGIVAYFLLAAFFSVAFFVALGITALLCFAACVGFMEAGKHMDQPIEEVEEVKHESNQGL